jgi:hypothetical protein
MLGSGNIEIDLHGLRTEEAKKKIDEAIRKADTTVYRIKLIHGYHRGHGLKDMIWDEYSYGRNSKVLRIQGGVNEGITELVLREY